MFLYMHLYCFKILIFAPLSVYLEGKVLKVRMQISM